MGIDIGAAFNRAGQFIQNHNPLTGEGRANIGKGAVKTVGGVTQAVGDVGNAVGNAVGNLFLPPAQAPTIFPVKDQPKADRQRPNPQGGGRTVYTNQSGKQYILPAGDKPGDDKMDARPDKLPTLRLQVQAEIEAKNGAIHTTPGGTRFFLSNPDRRGQRTVIEIDKSGQALEGAKARLYMAAKSNSAIVKRLDSEHPNRGAIGNTLANTKKTAVRQGARIDMAGQGAMNNIVWTPFSGLLKLAGAPQLKNAVNRGDKQIAQEQAARGVRPDKALEAGTSLFVNGVMAYGSGSVTGGLGNATKLSRTATFAAQTVVMPAASTVGSHAAQGRLGRATVDEIAISSLANLIGLPITAKTPLGQAMVGIGSGVITQTALGQPITAQGLLQSAVTRYAGAKGAHQAMKRGADSKPAPESAQRPPSIDVATRNLKTAVAQHREGRGSVQAVSAARLASVGSYKAHKSSMSPEQRRKWRDAAAKSEGIIAGARTDTSPAKSTAAAQTKPAPPKPSSASTPTSIAAALPQASSVVLTSQQGKSGSTQPSGNRATATIAGGAPQPESARPLPAAVEAVATKLGLSVADVQLLRDSLGGTFGAPDVVAYLKNRGSSPLNGSQATELVKTIRSSQQESTRSVSAAVDAALTRPAPLGQPRAVFTMNDWDMIAPQLNAQPALDNPAARKLRSVLLNGRVDPQAKENITNYLKSVGDEFTVPTSRSAAPEAEAVPTSNLSTTDAGFSKLLVLTGQSKAQVSVGVIDGFSTTAPRASVLFNSQAVPPATISSAEHGHGTTSLVGKAGRWVDIKTYMKSDNPSSSEAGFSPSIDRLAAENARVINISLSTLGRTGAHEWPSAMARHPDVLFVIAAGNEGKNSAFLPFARSIAAGMPNVIYVGNVDTAGNLAKSSTHGKTVDIYAPGVDRQVARGLGKAYDVQTGTSFSSPEVASVAAKMLVLCPTLKPAAVRDIIRQTASAPPIGATDADGSVARAGILNGDAATKVAALMTMTQRVGGLEKAANALKLSAPDRSRLLPIAQRQLALASSPERSAAPTSGTTPAVQTGQRPPQTTTPEETHGVRVHHIEDEVQDRVKLQRMTNEQISRLAGGTGATHIDITGSPDQMYIFAGSKHHGDLFEMSTYETDISISGEPLLWRAGLSDPRLVAAAETRALAIMATQAQALGFKTISIDVRQGSATAAEWADRGFSVASPIIRTRVDFDLTKGSQSWRQLVQKVKSLEIQLPAGLPADTLSVNDAATRGFFRKFLGR